MGNERHASWCRAAPPDIKTAVHDYFKITLENLREAELADQVVHDSDDENPRPATLDDFDDEGTSGHRQRVSPPATGEPPVAASPVAARVPQAFHSAQSEHGKKREALHVPHMRHIRGITPNMLDLPHHLRWLAQQIAKGG